jgi:hypothetical protein
MGAGLRSFLARLSVDTNLLSDFINRPEELIAEAGLSDTERSALLSHDQARIQLSLIEDTLGPNGVPAYAGVPDAVPPDGDRG